MAEPGFLIESFADQERLYDATAGIILRQLTEDVRNKGAAVLVAAGGSTPAPVYERLAVMQGPWEAVEVTLTDERWLPPTSDRSNEFMLRSILLQHEAARARFIPLWSPDVDPLAGAELAERRLAGHVPFSVVLLGMGADGHIASLFPGSPALHLGLGSERGKLCVAAPPGDPAPDIWRLSLTVGALRTASLVVLLVTGAEKRERLQAFPGKDLPVHSLLDAPRSQLRVLWAP